MVRAAMAGRRNVGRVTVQGSGRVCEVNPRICFATVLLVLAVSPLAAEPPPDAAFIVMEGPAITISAVHNVVSRSAEVGGHAYHVMPVHTGPARDLSGCCLIASLPPGQEPSIVGLPFVTMLHRGPVDPATVLPMGEEAVFAVGAWNHLLDEAMLPPPPGAEPFPNDALGPLINGELVGGNSGQSESARPVVGAAGQYQTSEFMIGSIAVGVVLPESTGSGENWSNTDPLYPGQNRRQLVYNQIVSGANWWATSGGTAASITFYYDQRMGVSTTYEPITISTANNGETLWVGSVLNTMGFTGTNAFMQAYDYDNWMRSTYGAEWAFGVFVADSLNDTDGMFPSLNSAFAYLYGPYQVMTYDNGTTGGQWYLSRMNQVFAHESGHIFGAPDEYAGAGTCTCANYGYLGVTNGNCVNCVANQTACVMASNTLSLCSFTRGHVGWRDSDSDGILDPVDGGLTLPSAYLDFALTPPYSGTPQITGHGTAQAAAWPSPTRSPCCINRVGVTYRIDGTIPVPAVPRDGAFNTDVENFDFTSSAQTNGPHLVVVTAADNWGSTTSTPITIVIDTTPPPGSPPTATIMEAPYSSNPMNATVNWAPGPVDPESGLAGHQVSLYCIQQGTFTPIATQYVPMPGVTWGFVGLGMQHGFNYYANVAAVNGAGLRGTAVASPNLTIDMTPPGPPLQVNDGGAGTDQYDRLSFNWSAAPEDISPISDYFLRIDDDLGNLVWGGWMGSPSTGYTATGLSLVPGTKYAAMVSAKNAAGLLSPPSVPSDGIMAVTFFPSIGAVKTTASVGMPVGVRSVFATSSGSYQPGFVYAQHVPGIAGIRTDSADPIALGAKVDIAGIVQLGPGGELMLWKSEAAPTGTSAVVRPLGLSGRSLGGGPLGLQPGVNNGSGANNVGLLVQIWGQVTFVSPGPPGYFVVDDGSGVFDQSGMSGVGVRCGSLATPTPMSFVKVVGVCSYESGFPVVLIRQNGDWW